MSVFTERSSNGVRAGGNWPQTRASAVRALSRGSRTRPFLSQREPQQLLWHTSGPTRHPPENPCRREWVTCDTQGWGLFSQGDTGYYRSLLKTPQLWQEGQGEPGPWAVWHGGTADRVLRQAPNHHSESLVRLRTECAWTTCGNGWARLGDRQGCVAFALTLPPGQGSWTTKARGGGMGIKHPE